MFLGRDRPTRAQRRQRTLTERAPCAFRLERTLTWTSCPSAGRNCISRSTEKAPERAPYTLRATNAGVGSMNRSLLEQPFAPAQIKQRRARNGVLDYVEGHSVIQRLNESLEGAWFFEVVQHEIREDEVLVLRPSWPSGLRSQRPAATRSVEEGWRVARAVASGEPLEVGHEAGLSVVRPAHVLDEGRPLALEAGALVAALGVLEVRQCGVVVLALLRVEDAHAHRTVDLGRHVRVRLREVPGGGFCPVGD